MQYEEKYTSQTYRFYDTETQIWRIADPDRKVTMVGPLQRAWATEICHASNDLQTFEAFRVSPVRPLRPKLEGVDSSIEESGATILIDEINKKYFKAIIKMEKIKQGLINKAMGKGY
jgi:hypothetical protein